MDAAASYHARLTQLSADLERLVRRLRSLTRHSWEPRRQAVLGLLGQLADLAAEAEQRGHISVPPLPDHSLADALVVISGDLLDALADAPTPALLAASEAAVRGAQIATK